MAAIDKMYLNEYYLFDEFRLWCLVNNPKLLYHFYNWNMNEKEFGEWKEYCYNNQKEILEEQHDRHKDIKTYRKWLKDTYKDIEYPLPDYSNEQIQEDIDYHNKLWNAVQNKEKWIEKHKLPITNFSCEEDKYLLWHCPIREIREEYLFKQCGYKEKWYYKLFFKE